MEANQKGFTLVEVMVVIAIIGILSSISIMQYGHIKAKTQAAQISSNLHVVEDGIIAAIIDGRTNADFLKVHPITETNFSSSVLSSYLTLANFTQLPPGISFRVQSSSTVPTDKDFGILVWVDGKSGTERILDELEKMFPRTVKHVGNREFVLIEAKTLRPREF
jgi:prepilin-type N-terminal cleavage/methylation domain-containing protein